MKKMTMIRLFALCISTCFYFLPAFSQGLEGLIVEKYYVANATDAADTDGGNLANGSVTYRLFVDMAPGYEFLAVYGVEASPEIFQPKHLLRLATSTKFFNNTDRGKEAGEKIGSTRVEDNTVAIDSWISVGGSSGGHIAVLKKDDTDGSILGLDGLLSNADPYAGIPLTTADGIIAGSPSLTTWLSLGPDIATYFGESAGNTGPVIEIADGSWSSLEGSSGATEDNYVLIGQFTTDGAFSYELNILMKDDKNQAIKYVSRNPSAEQAEILYPMLMNTVGKDIKAPSITMTQPSDGAIIPKNYSQVLSVDAVDLDGTVDSVEYIMDGFRIGSSHVPPFDILWETTAGTHQITAVATDNEGARAVSTTVNVTVVENSNVLPTVEITSPANETYFSPGQTVSLQANAADTDGDISLVEFYIDAVYIGSDSVVPYELDWTAEVGEAILTAVAIDNYGGSSQSVPVTINVTANVPPSITISYPSEGDLFNLGDMITITTDPTDTDGTVVNVDFLINGTSVSVDSESPFEITWTSMDGNVQIMAIATDNEGAKASNTVNIIVNVPPTIEFLSPVDNAKINIGKNITLSVDARDSDGSVSSVEFSIDNQVVHTDIEKPFEYAWTTVEGTHEIIAKAYDNHGAADMDTISVEIMFVAGISTLDQANRTFLLYPNPANSQVTIEMSGYEDPETVKIEIISMTGAILLNKVQDHFSNHIPLTLNIQDLKAGLYVLKFTVGESLIFRKFIKE
jgi:hypothetical protein